MESSMDNQVNMDGYKTNVDEVTKSSLKWSKDLLFSGRTQRGYEIDFDARIEWGCAPRSTVVKPCWLHSSGYSEHPSKTASRAFQI
jgi:hypothetical protein